MIGQATIHRYRETGPWRVCVCVCVHVDVEEGRVISYKGYLVICSLFIGLSVCPSIGLPICLYNYLSICLCNCLSI